MQLESPKLTVEYKNNKIILASSKISKIDYYGNCQNFLLLEAQYWQKN